MLPTSSLADEQDADRFTKRFMRRIVLTLLGTLVLVVGPLVIFIAYLFGTRLSLTHRGIFSSAPAGRLLLIPNICSRAVWLTTPVFMTLVAFKLGAEWIKSSESLRDSTEEEEQESKGETAPLCDARPSSTQFSLLVNVCATASLWSVFLALRHLRRVPSGSVNRVNLLTMALRTLIPLLAFAYTLSAIEGIWLHVVTLPTLFPQTMSRAPSKNLLLSRSIDDVCKNTPLVSECDGEQLLACSLHYMGNSCADAQGAVDILRGSNEAILTANNVSTINVIKFTPDTFYAPSASSLSSRTTPSTATALLLPYLTLQEQSQLSYEATTTGVRTTCDNITPLCNVHVVQPIESGNGGTGTVQVSGCPGKPGLLETAQHPLGPDAGWNITEFDPAGVNILPRGQSSNPFPISLSMIFNIDLGNETENTDPALLGGMVHTRGPRLFGLLWCQAEVLAPVRYRNDRGSIQVLDAKRAAQGAPEVWAISGTLYGARLQAKIYTNGQAAPLTPAANRSIALTTAYARSIASVLLSGSAGVHKASASIGETDVHMVQATYMPWAPVGFFTGLVVLYAVFASWICWEVWQRTHATAGKMGPDSEGLNVAAARLAQPGRVVFDLVDASKGDGLSTEENRDIRLRIGRKKDGQFGVHV